MTLVGDKITFGPASWSFNSQEVVAQFDAHVSKSVPLYHEGHDLILRMMPHFFTPTTRIVDIGCSTGTFLSKIAELYSSFSLEMIGIDLSTEMINYAKSRQIARASFSAGNFMDIDVSSVDVTVAFYTLQFVPPRYRQDMVNKIYQSLNWGGAFFLFEKTRGNDARFQDIFTNAYFKYKQHMGYSPEEIFGKYMALQGVLEPFSSKGNSGLLERAGFCDIETIFKFAPFEGVLAIK